jgi:CRP-like cAMP-binding protein
MPHTKVTQKGSPKATFLHRSAALDRVGADVLHRIVVRAAQVRVDRRDALWSYGDPVTHVYWIRSGVICERVPLPKGRELVLAFRGRGEVVGEVGALEAAVHGEATHATSADVHEEASLYALPITELATLLTTDTSLAIGLAIVTTDRRKRVEERLAAVLFRSAQARMAAVLLDLAVTFGIRDSRGVIVNLKLTHRDLAGLAGASRETASVALLEWRRDGIVLVEGKRVVVLDVERLAALARDG